MPPERERSHLGLCPHSEGDSLVRVPCNSLGHSAFLWEEDARAHSLIGCVCLLFSFEINARVLSLKPASVTCKLTGSLLLNSTK